MEYLPVRPLIKSNSLDGAWVTAKKVAERRRFKAIICSLKESKNASFDNDGHKVFQNRKNKINIFDIETILDVCKTVDSTKVAVINVNMCDLEISTDDFSDFTSVYKIEASGNKLQLDIFRTFFFLEELYLAGNKIDVLNLSIDDFVHLKILDLTGNKVLPEEIRKLGLMANLKLLNLSSNELLDLPMNLSVSDNKLHTFLELEELNLSNNLLASYDIFAILAGFKKLKKIDLSHNKFTGVPLLKSNLRIISANTVVSNEMWENDEQEEEARLFEEFSNFSDNNLEYKSTFMGIRIPSTLPEVDEEGTARSNLGKSDSENIMEIKGIKCNSKRNENKIVEDIQVEKEKQLEKAVEENKNSNIASEKIGNIESMNESKKEEVNIIDRRNMDKHEESEDLINTESEIQENKDKQIQEIGEKEEQNIQIDTKNIEEDGYIGMKLEEDITDRNVDESDKSVNDHQGVNFAEDNVIKKKTNQIVDENIGNETNDVKVTEDVEEDKTPPNIEEGKTTPNTEGKTTSNIEEDVNENMVENCREVEINKVLESEEKSIENDANQTFINKSIEEGNLILNNDDKLIESGEQILAQDVKDSEDVIINDKEDSERTNVSENKENAIINEILEDHQIENSLNEVGESKMSNNTLLEDRSGTILDLKIAPAPDKVPVYDVIEEDDENDDNDDDDVICETNEKIKIVIDRQHSKHEEYEDEEDDINSSLSIQGGSEEEGEEDESEERNIAREITTFINGMEKLEENNRLNNNKTSVMFRNDIYGIEMEKTSFGFNREVTDINDKLLQIMENRSINQPFSVNYDFNSSSITEMIRYICGGSSYQDKCPPFPCLEHLDLSFNKIHDERTLIPLIAWVNLNRLQLHNNPLTLSKTQKSSFIKSLLENKFKIQVDWLPPIQINKTSVNLNKSSIDTLDRVSNLPPKSRPIMSKLEISVGNEIKPVDDVEHIPLPKIKSVEKILKENKPDVEVLDLMSLESEIHNQSLMLSNNLNEKLNDDDSNIVAYMNKTAALRSLRFKIEHPMTYFERDMELYNKQKALQPINKRCLVPVKPKSQKPKTSQVLRDQQTRIYQKDYSLNEILLPDYKGHDKMLIRHSKIATNALNEMQEKYDVIRKRSLAKESEKMKKF